MSQVRLSKVSLVYAARFRVVGPEYRVVTNCEEKNAVSVAMATTSENNSGDFEIACKGMKA